MQYMPQEIEVWYIIPAIKREICKYMVNQGLKQKEVAEKLDVANSAVSQYLHAKRAKDICFSKKFIEEIRKGANNIITDKSCAMKEIQKLLRISRKKKILCGIHKELEEINCCCEVCLK